MEWEIRLREVCGLLAQTFPGEPPVVELDADARYVIRNSRHALRLSHDLVEGLGDRTAADLVQVLLAQDYVAALGVHLCLEVLGDLTWHPCPGRTEALPPTQPA
jgi:hypothetical protein